NTASQLVSFAVTAIPTILPSHGCPPLLGRNIGELTNLARPRSCVSASKKLGLTPRLAVYLKLTRSQDLQFRILGLRTGREKPDRDRASEHTPASYLGAGGFPASRISTHAPPPRVAEMALRFRFILPTRLHWPPAVDRRTLSSQSHLLVFSVSRV